MHIAASLCLLRGWARVPLCIPGRRSSPLGLEAHKPLYRSDVCIRAKALAAGVRAHLVRTIPALLGIRSSDPLDVGASSRVARLVVCVTAGPFGQTIDTRQRTGYNLWPSEISDLQAICKGLDATPSRQAFSVDTAGP